MGPKLIARLGAAYETCHRQLREQGFSVEVLDDFAEIERELADRSKEVTPLFQTKFFDFNGHNGFCHVLTKDGKPLSYYCSQLVDTGVKNYLDYHRMQLHRIYPENTVDRSWECPPMAGLSGLLMYSGEALNVPGSRTMQGSLSRLSLLARMNLYLGLKAWPGITASVGLARAAHVSRGLGEIYGARHSYPFATRWIEPPPDRRQDDAFLFSLTDDILYLAEIDARGLGHQT